MTTLLMIWREAMWLTKGLKAVSESVTEPATYLDNNVGRKWIQPKIKFNHGASSKPEEWYRERVVE